MIDYQYATARGQGRLKRRLLLGINLERIPRGGLDSVAHCKHYIM
jgi:hypothetical protein